MTNKGLWTTQLQERQKTIRAIRKDLIVKLSKDQLGYGELSHSDIAEIVGTTQPSVSRLLKFGKNISRVVDGD